VRIYDGLGDLPLFNPDLDPSRDPAVVELTALILDADALIIASPEYAHGVTGAMKNGLDWMVGNETFILKPVALLNASPRATHAQAALRETITVMSARIIEAASIDVPLPILGRSISEDAIVQHIEISYVLLGALEALQAAVRDGPPDA
jgi:NAD(P)H-dependent FMN reductase